MGKVFKVDCESKNEFVELSCPQSTRSLLKLLLDNGAQISLFNRKYLRSQVAYRPDERIQIKGITSPVIHTYGTAVLDLQIDRELRVKHKFHLVGGELDIPYTGLLGRDFFTKHGVVIDYAKGTLWIRDKPVKLRTEIEAQSGSAQGREPPKPPADFGTAKCDCRRVQGCLNISERPATKSTPKKWRENQCTGRQTCYRRDSEATEPRTGPVATIELGPREERILRIKVADTSLREGIVEKQELQEGVYLPEALVSVRNSSCLISVLNTREEAVSIQKPQIKVEQIPQLSTSPEQTVRKVEQVSSKAKSRISLLKENLRLDHLNDVEKQSVTEVCCAYNDIFHLPGDQLTYTDTIRHQIKLIPEAEGRVICSRPYRIPEAQKEALQREIDQMLADDIIVPSTSAWNFPLLMIPKKMDASGIKKWRVVADYRKLNEITINTVFPLPRIDEILDGLGKAKYFSTLDLAKGYYQVLLDEKDRELTAFSTPYAHYMYKRMPMGLRSAPATFQKLMNSVLMGLQGEKMFIYLDDVVIFGPSLEEHNARLGEAFQRLRQHNLKLQVDKCEFLRKEVTYLGHVLTEEGLKPDPNKLKAVAEYPQPKTTKALKSFLGLIGYYRRFLSDFSKVAKPLYELLKKGVTYVWGDKQENAFQMLKEKLLNPPILQYPDFSKPFIITTDASQEAIGAVLSQGEVGKDLPVAYASRTLNNAERNYSTIERELLAIVWAVKHYRPYVFGRKFTICTDHKPLQWVGNISDPSSRLMKFRIKLEEYDYQIVYKKGKHNQVADALSRIREVQSADVENESNESETNSRVNESEQQEITAEEKAQILREFHDAPVGGHQGIVRTYDRIRKYRTWTGMKKDIEDYIRKCASCQKNKITQNKTKMPLVITPTPQGVFDRCDIDIVGPLTVTDRDNRYILTFQDALTKFIVAEPIEKQDAGTVARVLVEKIILRFGIPSVILSDNGSNFLSDTLKRVCKLLGIDRVQTSCYHPQSNGALERSHRTITEFLRHYVNRQQTNWDEWLPFAVFVYNTTPHTAINYTPHELFFGRECNIPGVLQRDPSGVTYNYDDYVLELKEKMRQMHQCARQHNKQCKEKNKEYYDRDQNPKEFRTGDQVLLYDESVRRGRSRKLDTQWRGPFTVVRTKGPNVVIRLKRNKFLTVHANRLKEFF